VFTARVCLEYVSASSEGTATSAISSTRRAATRLV
jgi:hypothetical protein